MRKIRKCNGIIFRWYIHIKYKQRFRICLLFYWYYWRNVTNRSLSVTLLWTSTCRNLVVQSLQFLKTNYFHLVFFHQCSQVWLYYAWSGKESQLEGCLETALWFFRLVEMISKFDFNIIGSGGWWRTNSFSLTCSLSVSIILQRGWQKQQLEKCYSETSLLLSASDFFMRSVALLDLWFDSNRNRYFHSLQNCLELNVLLAYFSWLKWLTNQNF